MLPMLFGLLGSGLAGAGMLGAMSPLLAGAIGSGLGSYAETGDLGEGIKAGLGSFLGGKLAGSVLGSTSNAALNTATMTPNMQSAVSQGLPAAAGVAPPPRPVDLAPPAATAAATPKSGGILGLLGDGKMGQIAQSGMDYMKSPEGIGAMVGSQALPALMPGSLFGGGDDGSDGSSKENLPEMRSKPREVRTPREGYQPGVDPEFYYNVSKPATAGSIYRYTTKGYAEGGPVEDDRTFGDKVRDAFGGLTAERENPTAGFASGQHAGGIDRNMNVGMLAAANKGLAAQLGVKPMGDEELYKAFGAEQINGMGDLRRMLQDQAAKAKDAKAAAAAAAAANALPETRAMRTPNPGYRPGVDPEFDFGISRMAEGGPVPGGNEKDVITAAVAAIKGQDPQPELALGAFVAKYGEDALRDLVDRVQSGEMDATAARSTGKIRGPGDGMQDMVPAKVDGGQDVLLSDGEFVVPADVVSGLGNGSSEAGARELERMLERVRKLRTGSSEQPDRIPQSKMVPA